MNIEIANRLVNLRKENNLSQEGLAEKLGISRQAVSKWERAEASPDTDNLILLARLYGVSLDELLQTDDEIPKSEFEEETKETDETTESEESGDCDGDVVNISLSGVHVKEKDGSEVHIGWNGIHVNDTKKGDNVHVGKDGVYVNGEQYDTKDWVKSEFPIGLFVLIAYLIMGFGFNLWHPGWLIFFAIPVLHSLVQAIRKRNAHMFAFPCLVAPAYLILGFCFRLWHPGWVLFLTIPVYYSLVEYFKYLSRRYKK